MKQCQEELMREKNSIIKNLQRTEKSLLDELNTNPRLWNRECFEFKLTSQVDLVLKADLKKQDRAKKKRNDSWLNSTVQLLWHIDVFRQSINRISGHYRCLQEYCVYCHVKALFSDYEYNSGKCLYHYTADQVDQMPSPVGGVDD